MNKVTLYISRRLWSVDPVSINWDFETRRRVGDLCSTCCENDWLSQFVVQPQCTQQPLSSRPFKLIALGVKVQLRRGASLMIMAL